MATFSAGRAQRVKGGGYAARLALWSKRCKDKSLIGAVKETIMQVSRSKKWESKPVLDEQGMPLLTAKGKKVLRTSYSVLQDDFFNAMKAAEYTDLERGERGSTEEHLTVTQFKVAQEQRRLEEVAAQVKQGEQAVVSLRKEAKIRKTAALTIQEIEAMGKKTLTGNISLTPYECDTLKRYAMNGLAARAELSQLQIKLATAEKTAAVWKQRYEILYEKYQKLKKEVQSYLDALKLAPEKVRAFLDSILSKMKQPKITKDHVHKQGQER